MTSPSPLHSLAFEPDSPTPETGPMLMHIGVRLVDRRVLELRGVFSSSFDAYEYALDKYGRLIARIEVKKVQPLHDHKADRRATAQQPN